MPVGPVPNSPNFSVLCFALKNVNSLSNKTYYVYDFCVKNGIDIFAVTETWLLPAVSDSTVNIDGYNIFRNDFISARPKYGVCMYIKNSLKAIIVNDQPAYPNSLALFLPAYNLHVLTVYRPPSYSQDDNNNLISYIRQFSVGKELIILGDFNLPSIQWNRPIADLNLTPTDTLFLDLFTTLGLHQHVMDPTFVSSGNTLDLVLTSEHDRLLDLNIFPPFPHCGHSLVYFTYIFQNVQPADNHNPQRNLDWARGDYHSISSNLQSYDWVFEFENRNPSQATDHLTNILTDLANLYIPVKPPPNHVPPWHKRVPQHLHDSKSKCWTDYVEFRQMHGRRSHLTLQKLFLFNAANEALRQSVIESQREYEQYLARQRKTRPKLFHAYIRKKKKARPTVGPLLVNGTLSDDPQIMSNKFVEAFASVYVDEILDNPSPHQLGQSEISDIAFTVEDVKLQLESLKCDSAMGPDNLHPILLKRCASVLAPAFYIIFRSSLDYGMVPDLWKHSHISPIFKKGKRTDPLNYRPISLTPVPCKTLERIITKTLYQFLDDHLIFDDAQFGFRANRSVSDQLLLTYDKITQWYDAGYTVDLILFDFVKAFDRVHHETLLAKLSSIGISGNLLQWIRSFLTNRTMSVSINGSHSRPVLVISGVPQGSVIGPLLFLLFVNYICANITCNYKLFADDLKLYIHHTSCSSQPYSQELQHNIDLLFSTAASWGLEFAPDKCVHLRFKRGPVLQNNTIYSIGGEALVSKSSHKDLGVTVDTTLRFHPHIRSAVAKAGGVASNLLKSTLCRLPEFMTTLFMSDVRPLLDFASPVWNTRFSGDLSLLESVQRRWTKQVYNLSSLSYEDRLASLNLFSIKGRLLRSDLIQCYKIFHNLSPIKPQDLFTLTHHQGLRGHRYKIFVPHSATEARKRFFSCRIIPHWNSLPPEVVDSPSLNQFKSRLAHHLHDTLFTPGP